MQPFTAGHVRVLSIATSRQTAWWTAVRLQAPSYQTLLGMTLLQCKMEGLKMLFDFTTWAMPCVVNKAASAVPHA
jgi:hypothetical protein